VLALVLLGRTSKQVARALHISDLTVRKHRENLMRKLGVQRTQQLLATAPSEYDKGGIHDQQGKLEHLSERPTRGTNRERT
jgi:hypothetical protein